MAQASIDETGADYLARIDQLPTVPVAPDKPAPRQQPTTQSLLNQQLTY